MLDVDKRTELQREETRQAGSILVAFRTPSSNADLDRPARRATDRTNRVTIAKAPAGAPSAEAGGRFPPGTARLEATSHRPSARQSTIGQGPAGTSIAPIHCLHQIGKAQTRVAKARLRCMKVPLCTWSLDCPNSVWKSQRADERESAFRAQHSDSKPPSRWCR